jgi:hypothetical protein
MATRAGRAVQLDKVITEAAKSGNLEAAIKKHGRGLSVADVNVLKTLTASDLRQIGNLRTKLGPLGKALADNNGGIF